MSENKYIPSDELSHLPPPTINRKRKSNEAIINGEPELQSSGLNKPVDKPVETPKDKEIGRAHV